MSALRFQTFVDQAGQNRLKQLRPDHRLASGEPGSDLIARPLEIIPIEDLIATHPDLREPIIEGLLRRGETMNLIGPPKAGKSWFAMHLATAVARGLPWLGAFQTRQAKVLYIDNELHAESSAARFRDLLAGLNLTPEDVAGGIDFVSLRGRLVDLHELAHMLRSIEPATYAVVILDALYRFEPAGSKENDNSDRTMMYNAIDAIARDLDCAVVAVHHTGKGNQSGRSTVDLGAGGNAMARAADTHLVLRPHKEPDVVTVEAETRSWPTPDPICVRLDFPALAPAPDEDPSQISRPGRGGPRKTRMSTDEFVRRFVTGEFERRSTVVERAIAAGMTKTAANECLRAAKQNGLVDVEKLSEPGNPEWYRIAFRPPN